MPQGKPASPRAPQARIRDTTGEDEARTGASPAAPERQVPGRRRKLDPGGSPRVVGWPWQTTAFSVHGGAGAREEGKAVVLPGRPQLCLYPEVSRTARSTSALSASFLAGARRRVQVGPGVRLRLGRNPTRPPPRVAGLGRKEGAGEAGPGAQEGRRAGQGRGGRGPEVRASERASPSPAASQPPRATGLRCRGKGPRVPQRPRLPAWGRGRGDEGLCPFALVPRPGRLQEPHPARAAAERSWPRCC